MTLKTYSLVNAVERNRRTPDTFEIPSQTERHGLCVGDRVKLGFVWTDRRRTLGAPGAERMWVLITRVGDGVYFGTLDNIPADPFAAVDHGGVVAFAPEHVFGILPTLAACLAKYP